VVTFKNNREGSKVVSMASYTPPAGFRFQPEEEDLVLFYLRPKAAGQPLPFPDVIFECDDLYGEKEPCVIWDMYAGPSVDETLDDLYFFTKLKWLSDSRVDRRAGSGGTWANESSKTIYARGTRVPIAKKRKFRYVNPGSSQDGAWIMQEYSLPITKAQPDVGSSSSSSSSSSSYVVCRLRKNNRPDSDSSEPESPPPISSRERKDQAEKMKRLINLLKRKREQRTKR
jgi:hypothetical protein